MGAPGFIGEYDTNYELQDYTYYPLSDNDKNGGVGFYDYVETSPNEKYLFGSRGTIAIQKDDELTFINAPDSINFRYAAYVNDTLLLWGEYSAGYARPTDFTFGYVTNQEFHQTINYSVSDDYFMGEVKDMKRIEGKWLFLVANAGMGEYNFTKGIRPVKSGSLIEGAIINDTTYAVASLFKNVYTLTKGTSGTERIMDSDGNDLRLSYYPDRGEYKHGLLVFANASNLNIIEMDN
jgi:hypothetical protein